MERQNVFRLTYRDGVARRLFTRAKALKVSILAVHLFLGDCQISGSALVRVKGLQTLLHQILNRVKHDLSDSFVPVVILRSTRHHFLQLFFWISRSARVMLQQGGRMRAFRSGASFVSRRNKILIVLLRQSSSFCHGLCNNSICHVFRRRERYSGKRNPISSIRERSRHGVCCYFVLEKQVL